MTKGKMKKLRIALALAALCGVSTMVGTTAYAGKYAAGGGVAKYDTETAVGPRAVAWGGKTGERSGPAGAYGGATAIGHYALAYGMSSTALGSAAHAYGRSSTALGNNSYSLGNYSVAIGGGNGLEYSGARAYKDRSIAIGYVAQANGVDSISLGVEAVANETNTLAFGSWAKASGLDSISIGVNSKATYQSATAIGTQASATASWATAMGKSATASGHDSTAIGTESYASGKWSTAVGVRAKAKANGATAFGDMSEAKGLWADALGGYAKAYGDYSVAVGANASTDANSKNSVAIGEYASITKGENSVAIGQSATVSAGSSVAVGQNSKASGSGNVVIGMDAKASGVGSIAIGTAEGSGKGSEATKSYTLAVGYNAHATEDRAHAYGTDTFATGVRSLAMGYNSQATKKYASSIGSDSRATGEESTAVGYNSYATASYATAMGVRSRAESEASTAVGVDTKAAHYASAFGVQAKALSNWSVALGKTATVYTESDGAVALGDMSEAKGKWSSALGGYSETNGQYATAVGHSATAGTIEDKDEGRSNLVANYSTAIGADAHANYESTLAVGQAAKAGAKQATAVGQSASASGERSTAVGQGVIAEEYDSSAFGVGAEAKGKYSVALGARARAWGYRSVALGDTSKAEGDDFATALGPYAYANGNHALAVGIDNDALGENTIAVGYQAYVKGNRGIAIGKNAKATAEDTVAVGTETAASGSYADAFGYKDTASGTASTALGYGDTASAEYATAVGASNTASKKYASAFGASNTASGDYSTALGYKNSAANSNAVAIGSTNAAKAGSSVAIGYNNAAGEAGSIAIGSSNSASGQNSVAIGQSGKATATQAATYGYKNEAAGAYSTVLGNNSKATSDASYAAVVGSYATASGLYSGAFGYKSNAVAENTIAIGNAAYAEGVNSVALGANSYTTDEDFDTVSVGNANSGLYRRIINVANANKNTDAAAFGQIAQQGQAFVLTASANVAAIKANDPNTTVATITIQKGTIAEKDIGFVSGGDVYAYVKDNAGIVDYDKKYDTKYTSWLSTDFDRDTEENPITHGKNSAAYGYGANAKAADSVAIGSYSTATEAYTFSVGSADPENVIQRRIVNVATGKDNTDAATVGQLLGTTEITLSSTANTATLKDKNGNDILNITVNDLGGSGSGSAQKYDSVVDYSNVLNWLATDTVYGVTTAVHGEKSVAYGYGANASAAYGVALGADSVAKSENEVSFGHKATDISTVTGSAYGEDLTRKLTNVAVGEELTDAVNVSQLIDNNRTYKVNNAGSVTVYDKNAKEVFTISGIGSGEGGGGGSVVDYGASSDNHWLSTDFIFDGENTVEHGTNSTAYGYGANAKGAESVAIGKNALADGDGSIAIGANSVAKTGEDGMAEISFGHSATDIDPTTGAEYGTALKRKLVNVDFGTQKGDAATWDQSVAVGQTISATADEIEDSSDFDENAKLKNVLYDNQGKKLATFELGSLTTAGVENGTGFVSADTVYNASLTTAQENVQEISGANKTIKSGNGTDLVSFNILRSTDAGAATQNDYLITKGYLDSKMSASASTILTTSLANSWIATDGNTGEHAVDSTAYGIGASAGGDGAVAVGKNASASGNHSVAIGDGSVATSDYEVSFGGNEVYKTDASGQKIRKTNAAGEEGFTYVAQTVYKHTDSSGTVSYVDEHGNAVNIPDPDELTEAYEMEIVKRRLTNIEAGQALGDVAVVGQTLAKNQIISLADGENVLKNGYGETLATFDRGSVTDDSGGEGFVSGSQVYAADIAAKQVVNGFSGGPAYEMDADGKYILDNDGAKIPVYKKDKDGNYLDENGNITTDSSQYVQDTTEAKNVIKNNKGEILVTFETGTMDSFVTKRDLGNSTVALGQYISGEYELDENGAVTYKKNKILSGSGETIATFEIADPTKSTVSETGVGLVTEQLLHNVLQESATTIVKTDERDFKSLYTYFKDVGVPTHNGAYSAAYGYDAEAMADQSVAIGYGAKVNAGANSSVAIGANSVADDDGVVSVGGEYTARLENADGDEGYTYNDGEKDVIVYAHIDIPDPENPHDTVTVYKLADGTTVDLTEEQINSLTEAYSTSQLTRRIVNVADGTKVTDAATYGQLIKNDTYAVPTEDNAETGATKGTVNILNNKGEVAFTISGIGLGSGSGDSVVNTGDNVGDTAGKWLSTDFVADGEENEVEHGDNSTAYGYGANAKGANSVAIGANSTATDENEVSFGGEVFVTDEDGNQVQAKNEAGDLAYTYTTTVDDADVTKKVFAHVDEITETTTYLDEAGVDVTADVNAYLGAEDSAGLSEVYQTTQMTRRLTNIADGVNNTDAATFGQIAAKGQELNFTDKTKSLNIVANNGETIATINLTDLKIPASDETETPFIRRDDEKHWVDQKWNLETTTTDSEGTTTVTPIEGVTHGENSVTLGYTSNAAGENSVAFGYGATTAVNATRGIAIGAGASVALPEDAAPDAVTESGIAIGTGATVTQSHALAFGTQASAAGENAVALGAGAVATAQNAVAIGAGSIATEANTVSVGSVTVALGNDGKAIQATTDEGDLVFIAVDGEGQAETNEDGSYVYIYKNTDGTYTDGKGVALTGDELAAAQAKTLQEVAAVNQVLRRITNVADGQEVSDAATYGQIAKSEQTIDADNNVIYDNAGNAIATIKGLGGAAASIVNYEEEYKDKDANTETTETGYHWLSTDFGKASEVTHGKDSAAYGYQANATGDYAAALGYNAKATAEGATAIGTGTIASEAYTVSVGGAETTTRDDDRSYAQATDENGYLKYMYNDGTTAKYVYKDEERGTYTNEDGRTVTVNPDALTVVYKETRRITNVAAGTQDTDAANVGQLAAKKQVINFVNNKILAKDGTWIARIEGLAKTAGSSLKVAPGGADASTDSGIMTAIDADISGATNGRYSNFYIDDPFVTYKYDDETGDPVYDEDGNPVFIDGDNNEVEYASDTVVTGINTRATAQYGSAFGNNAKVSNTNGTALGYNAQVSAKNAVALGANAVADEENAVSVGNSTTSETRKIVNVAAGEYNTDAATYAQIAKEDQTISLGATTAPADGETDSRTNVLKANDGTVLATFAAGSVAKDNTGFVSGGEVYGAIAKTGQTINANNKIIYTNEVNGDKTAIATFDVAQKSEGIESDGEAKLTSKGYVDETVENAQIVRKAVDEEGSYTNGIYTQLGTESVITGAGATGYGYDAAAAAANSVAVGHGANVANTATGAVAIGQGATVNAGATDSVALGAGSVAAESNTVSVGASTQSTRKIVNVTAGTEKTDAATYGQTLAAVTGTLSANNTSLVLKAKDGVTGLGSITISSGSVEKDNEGFMSGGAMYAELRPEVDGLTYVGADQSTADNLAALDKKLGKLSEEVTNPTYISQTNTVSANLAALDAKAIRTEGDHLDKDGQETGETIGAGDYKGQHISKTNNVLIANDGTVLATFDIGEGGDSVVDYDADTKRLSTDLGDTVIVHGEGSTAYGYGSRAQAVDSVAIGNAAVVDATAESSVAIGSGANVNANATGSVALGNGSVASVANTVSVGSTSQTRKIVNVTAGTENTDAATYGQLISSASVVKDATSGVQTVSLKHNDTNIADVTFSIGGEGQVAASDKGLLSGATVYAYVNPADGTYVKTAKTTAENLTALDTKIGAEQQGTYYASDASIEAKLKALDEKIGAFTTATGEATYISQANTVSKNLALLDDKAIAANADDEAKEDDKKTGQVINSKNKKLLANDGTVLATIEVGEGGGDSVVDYDTAKQWLSTDFDAENVEHGTNSTAYGYGANAKAEGSVAIGYGSVATEANTFSVGSSSLQRRITNVAAGYTDYDAVNFSQINTVGPKVTTDRWGSSKVTGADGTEWLGTYIENTLNKDGTLNSNGTVGANISELNAKAVAKGQIINKTHLTIYANDGTELVTFSEYGGNGGIGGDDTDETEAADVKLVSAASQTSSLPTSGSGSSISLASYDPDTDTTTTPVWGDIFFTGTDTTKNKNLVRYSEMGDNVQKAAYGSWSTTFGYAGVARSTGGFAFGQAAYVDDDADMSGAIGTWSVATEADTVSFGHKAGDAFMLGLKGAANFTNTTFATDYTRRLVNVSAGYEDTDVTNFAQIKVEAPTYTDANAGTSYLTSSLKDGKITKYYTDDEGESVAVEVDGKVLDENGTVGANLAALDAKAVQSGQSYTIGKDSAATIYANDGTALATISVKTGTITSGETGLVTGGAVYSKLGELSANGTYKAIKADGTVSDNLAALDKALSEIGTGSGSTDTGSGSGSTDTGSDSSATGSGNIIGTEENPVENSYATGSNNKVYADGSSATGSNNIIGSAEKDLLKGVSATGDGNEIYANDSTAVGANNIIAEGAEDSVAIGDGNEVTGVNVVAVGLGNKVSGETSVAIGNGNEVSGEGTVAIGTGITTSAKNAVVLGVGSTATDSNDNVRNDVVSVGSVGGERQIINVAAGTQNTDAANFGQLLKVKNYAVKDGKVTLQTNAGTEFEISGLGTGTGTGVEYEAGDNVDITDNTISVKTGTIASGETGLVTGGAVYSKLGELSSTGEYKVLDATKTVSDNLALLDAALNQAGVSSKNEITGEGNTVTGSGNTITGEGNKVTGDSNIVVGEGASATGTNNKVYSRKSSASGSASTVNAISEMVVDDASGSQTTSNGSTALGNGNSVGTAEEPRSGSFAVGDSNTITADNTGVVGVKNIVSGEKTFVLGSNVNTDVKNSVILGYGSTATRDNVISIGSDGGERQIINVAAGTVNTDAANFGQLVAKNTFTVGSNGVVTVKTNSGEDAFYIDGIGSGTYENVVYGGSETITIDGDRNISVKTGTITSGETGLVTGGAVHDALAALEKKIDEISSGSGSSGSDSTTTGSGNTTTGEGASATGNDNTVEGAGASATGNTNIVVGEGSSATGNYNKVYSAKPTASGSDTDSTVNAISLTANETTGTNTTSGNSKATGDSNDIGTAEAPVTDSYAVGYSNKIYANNSTATGSDNTISADASDSIAAGKKNEITAKNATAVGSANKISGEGSTGIGSDNTVSVASALGMGMKNTVSAKESVASGMSNTVSGEASVASGIKNEVSGAGSVAFGTSNTVSGDGAVATGADNTVSGSKSGATGSSNKVYGDNSYAVGSDNVIGSKDDTAAGQHTYALGDNISATGNNAVVLGSGSTATRDNVVSVGSEGGERQIINVAPGTEGTDAVNVNQMNSMRSEMSQEAKDAGAVGAALAGLHPLEYDPSNKVDFAVASGTYRGQTTFALGAFFRPTQDVMFSVGSTLGNTDTAWNLGASFKLGPRSARSAYGASASSEVNERVNRLAQYNLQLVERMNELSAENQRMKDVISQILQRMQMSGNVQNTMVQR